jgi:hypothetical protein
MANGATIQSLTTRPGLGALSRGLGTVSSFYHEPEQIADVAETVRRHLKDDPRLKDVKLRVQRGIQGGYFPKRDLVTLGVVNPAVVGHELGHAKNLRQSRVYGKILMAAQGVANVNNTLAVPAMLAIRGLVGDKDVRREILNILSGASAAVAAPGLVEEVSASVDAVKFAPNKLQAVKSLIPAFLTHAVSSLAPVGIYQLGQHI